MEALFHTASFYLNDCVEAHFLRGMRVILCLSMYSFMTKRMSARLSIGRSMHRDYALGAIIDIDQASGLRIARWARLHEQVSSHNWVPWRKVYRTLLFMEW